MMAHGDAREGKWRGNWRIECVASTLTLSRNVVYPAHRSSSDPTLLPLMRTPRLPAVYWTDYPADLNGLVRFGERRNLVSACVPSGFKRALPTDLSDFQPVAQSSHLLRPQNGFAIHLASSPITTGDLLPENGVKERIAEHSLSSSVELRVRGAVPSLLHTSLCVDTSSIKLRGRFYCCLCRIGSYILITALLRVKKSVLSIDS